MNIVTPKRKWLFVAGLCVLVLVVSGSILLLVIARYGSVARPQGWLTIISPTKGQVFHPGDTIIVVVSLPPGFQPKSVSVLGENVGIHFEENPPFQVSVPVTRVMIGRVEATVMAEDRRGGSSLLGKIDVLVEPPLNVTLVKVSATPKDIHIPVIGMREHLFVHGEFSDGSTADITNLPETSIISLNPGVARIEDLPQGKYVITAVAPGKTQVVVTHGQFTDRIDVSVQD